MQTDVRWLAVLMVLGFGSAAFADDDVARKRVVSVEVSIVELAEKGAVAGGPEDAEKLLGKIRELESKGAVASWTRVRLSALEESIASAQFGERAPVATGRTFSNAPRAGATGTGGAAERDRGAPGGFDRGGGFGGSMISTAYTIQDFGTHVAATPRVEGEGSILLELNIQKTGLAREPKRAADAPPQDSSAPARIATILANSTVRVPNGKTVLLQGIGTSSEKDSGETLIFVTARADAAPKGAGAKPQAARDAGLQQIKIFALKHVNATDASTTIASLFAGQPVTMGIDQRSNSLIAKGTTEQLEVVEALLLRLDEDKPKEKGSEK